MEAVAEASPKIFKQNYDGDPDNKMKEVLLPTSSAKYYRTSTTQTSKGKKVDYRYSQGGYRDGDCSPISTLSPT